ncbi:recombinase family protein [Paenibacillus sp. FSL K6-1122]|uniref:recombinase family protein n=1 Tax=Paenibacillus sp. FSL K6-1122 TaxID=2954512 RepID=UPI0030EBDEE7
MEYVSIAAYCRVSTKHDDQLNSLDAQVQYYNSYIDGDNKTKLHEVYYDTLSATKWEKRKGFKKMLYDAGLDFEVSKRGNLLLEISDRPPLFNRILVKDVSRFARNIDSVDIIRKLRDKRVFIDFTNMNLSTENMSEDMMLGMFILFAERESKDRSEKTIWGLARSAEEGRIRVKDDYYGYRYIKEGRELEVVNDEAENIQLIFYMYAHGLGFRKIIQELDILKIKTRKGKSFSPTTISRILKNVGYTGTLIRNKLDAPLVFTSKKTATLKDESEWKVHENRIPVIIDRKMFDLAQNIRKGKVNHTNRVGTRPPTSRYSKLLVCDVCGCNYTKNKENKTGRDFMNCTTKKRFGVLKCSSPNVSCELLEKAIHDFAKNKLKDTIGHFKDTYIYELNLFQKELEERIDNQQIDKASDFKDQIAEKISQEKKVIKLYSMGNFDEETLDELVSEIKRDRLKLEQELKKCTSSNEDLKEEIDEINNAIKQIKNFKVEINYSEEEVLELIDAIRIRKLISTRRERKRIILTFEFKIFKKLNQIVEKYAGMNKVQTDNSVSAPYDLY